MAIPGAVSPQPRKALWVVMPVYDEEAILEAVTHEWLSTLRETLHGRPFVFAALNDGSKDGSLTLLEALAARNPEMKVTDKDNSGHGQTCLLGYAAAVAAGAAWVLQIDSDGQCDPRFFSELWARRGGTGVVFGFRKVRLDGAVRLLISRFASLVVFMATGTWVPDPNVPYRLIRSDLLRPLLPLIPKDFRLANVLLSVLLERQRGIRWIDIRFRRRPCGRSSYKPFSLIREGFRLIADLRKCKGLHNAMPPAVHD